jgi:hypothetical protein
MDTSKRLKASGKTQYVLSAAGFTKKHFVGHQVTVMFVHKPVLGKITDLCIVKKFVVEEVLSSSRLNMHGHQQGSGGGGEAWHLLTPDFKKSN